MSRSFIDSKQETSSLHVKVCFCNAEVHQKFLRFSCNSIVINVVDIDGSVQGKLKPIENAEPGLVVGNVNKKATVGKGVEAENRNILSINNKSQSLVPPAISLPSVEEDNVTESVTIQPPHFTGMPGINITDGQGVTNPTGEIFEHNTASSGHSLSNAGMPPAPLSHSSHVPAGRPRLGSISTVSTGTADQESAVGVLVPEETVLMRRTLSVQEEKKRKHTMYCVLHGIETSIGKFYETQQDCEYFFDKTFASGLEQLLDNKGSTSFASCNVDDLPGDDVYLKYIEDHLKCKLCTAFCSRLWKYCAANKICTVFQYIDEEGLLILSRMRKEQVGTICKGYCGYESFKKLGEGGFGDVYEYKPDNGPHLAIKVEKRHPLADSNAKLFNAIMSLDHPNVIRVMEYLTGPVVNGKRQYLFVMPYMNQRDLKQQFKLKKSVLEYMASYPKVKNLIFRNYLSLFHQVFDGLKYLKSQRIIHRDIKTSNILVHQSCTCQNSMLCNCPEADETLYVLGDLDLLCLEEGSSATNFEEWIMTQHDPAGTVEMKPPEAFYKSSTGELVISCKSDIWSGCVTMMNILIGKGANWEPHSQISKFLKTITSAIRTATNDIGKCCSMVENMYDKLSMLDEFKSVSTPLLNDEIDVVSKQYTSLRKLLNAININLKEMQSFQGGVPEVYKEDSPLAGILSTVYVANGLHWVCLSKLPDVYDTVLWKCMKKTLECISEGVRFFPDNRQDAGHFVDCLKGIQLDIMQSVQAGTHTKYT